MSLFNCVPALSRETRLSPDCTSSYNAVGFFFFNHRALYECIIDLMGDTAYVECLALFVS